MNRPSRLLARHSRARQVEAGRRATAIASATDREVLRIWRSLLRVLRSPGDVHAQVLALLRLLPVLVRQRIERGLAEVALWGHRSARQALAQSLPRDMLAIALQRSGGEHARTDPHRDSGADRQVPAGRVPAPGAAERGAPPLAVPAGLPPDAPGPGLGTGGGGAHARPDLSGALAWTDLLAPFREPQGELSKADLLAVLFPPPSEERVREIVHATGWRERIASGTGLARPEAVAARIVTGMMLGHNQGQLAAELLPAVQGVQTSARRLARTEGLRVAAALQRDCHEGLGDLVAGYQVHATLDSNTRPEHRKRDKTIYWFAPKAGEHGMDQCPQPPQEADGSMAWNCRCYLTPVLRS